MSVGFLPPDEFVDHNGELRVLGTKPPPPGADAIPTSAPVLIDRAEWQEFTLPIVTPVKDQGSFGACNGHAAAKSLELSRWVNGQEPVSLSAWFVYAILCGGIDRGSSISEALTLLQDKGTCLDATIPHGTINPRRLPPAAYDEGQRFKIVVGSALTTFDEMASAAQRGELFNFSLRVGANFDHFDDDGVVGVSVGPGNHAICGGVGMKRRKSGLWLIEFENSWRPTWGFGGRAWFGEEHIAHQTWFEAYTIKVVKLDPSDPNLPPVARG